MQQVLNDPEDDKHKALIVAAFGQKAWENDRDTIKENVNNIKAANIRTRVAKGKRTVFRKAGGRATGNTKWVKQGSGEWRPDSMQFGNEFWSEYLISLVDQCA